MSNFYIYFVVCVVCLWYNTLGDDYFMKLYYDKRLKDPTYYLQEGVRNGKKSTTHNIRKLGKHSELLKITDDPLSYVKELIVQINEDKRVGKKETHSRTYDLNEKVEKTDNEISASTALNIGYFFLQYIMKDLSLKEFFDNITRTQKNTFDCFTISRFLTYDRILSPGSKLHTCGHLASYYETPDFNHQQVLRFMDILEKHYDEYLTWLYRKSNNIVKRDISVLYYDCTNFFFECDEADKDVVDEVTGEYLSYGLRKYGFSKEHRPNPIVEMGLFMDKQGIPISMCLHPGNMSEQLTAIPLEEDIVKMIDNSQFIYCSDGGLGSYTIRKFNSLGGRAFIVTQSIKKLSDTLKEAVFNDFDFRLLSDNSPIQISDMKAFDTKDKKNLHLYNDRAYKVIVADKVIDLGLYEERLLKNGKIKKYKAKGELKQRLIITFSRKMMEYQRNVRAGQVERARELVKRSDPEEIKKGPNDVKRFMKRVAETKSGEKADVTYTIDEEKIEQEAKYDGFYAIATNLNDPAKDIIEVASKRYKIEDCFRIMKTNLTGRPVNHRLPERIKAHFLICYTALLVYRLLEVKLDEQGTHVTPISLITTLQNINVVNNHDIVYDALYKGSTTLDALVQLTDMILDRGHYEPKHLNKIKRKILK